MDTDMHNANHSDLRKTDLLKGRGIIRGSLIEETPAKLMNSTFIKYDTGIGVEREHTLAIGVL